MPPRPLGTGATVPSGRGGILPCGFDACQAITSVFLQKSLRDNAAKCNKYYTVFVTIHDSIKP